MSSGVRLTGQEYLDFVGSEWGPEWYWDDTLFRHNGEEVEDIGEVQPSDEVVLLEGTIYKGYGPGAGTLSALTFCRKWLRQRKVTTLIVEVPNEKVESVRVTLAERGCKVLR